MAARTGIGKSALFAGGLALLAAASASACITPQEVKAQQIRFIDLQLKVAAVRCRFEEAHIAKAYNSWATRHRSSIKASKAPLEGYLLRSASLDLDRYVTRTANLISRESMQVADFCANAYAAARLVSQLEDPRYVLDLMPVAYRLPEQVCRDLPRTAEADVDGGFIEDARR